MAALLTVLNFALAAAAARLQKILHLNSPNNTCKVLVRMTNASHDTRLHALSTW